MTARPCGLAARPAMRRAALELALVWALFNVYRLGRSLARHHEGAALAHGRAVHRMEALLHLPSEAGIQNSIGSADMFQWADIYYVAVHFPVTAAFLVWGFVCRPRREYQWARNLLVLQTSAALVLHIAYPLAPPRMFPSFGFVDTMSVFGPSAYNGPVADVANQYAAMPSLHVGWAFTIALVLWRTRPGPMAALAAAHAAITVAVVLITANHWLLDCAVGVLLVFGAEALLHAAHASPVAEERPEGPASPGRRS